MRLLPKPRKQTKKSYLANACVAFVIGAIMIGCTFVDPDVKAKDFYISAGLVWVMGLYWLMRHRTFDSKREQEKQNNDWMF